MKNLKFRIKSPAHSEVLQKMLFGLGYKWEEGVRSVSYANKPHLYTSDDGCITFGYTEHVFRGNREKEVDTSFLDFFIKDEKQQKIAELKKTIEQAKKQIEELE